MSTSALAEMTAWADSQLPMFVEQATASVLERIPLYRKGAVVPLAELRRSIKQNLTFLIGAIAQDEAVLDLRVPRETGRRRAHQSAPLPEVLQVYRIAFATLWDGLVSQARISELPTAEDELLSAASRIWQLTDQHALAITEAFRTASADLLISQQHRRSALVETLLTGQATNDAAPWDAAALLGLPPDGELVVVAAETRRLATEGLPRIEAQLAAAGFASGWRLTPALQLGVVAVQSGAIGDLLDLVRDVAQTRTGVSPIYRAINGTPRALLLARAALATLPPQRAGVTMFSASPLAALMACQPGEGERLAQEVLGPVLAMAEDDRDVLLETLHAYLDRGGSAEQAAVVLHCHPNTVRYRLRRLHELTGRTLSDPYGMAELAAASYALRVANARATPITGL